MKRGRKLYLYSAAAGVLGIIAAIECMNRRTENTSREFGKTIERVDLLRKIVAILCADELHNITGMTLSVAQAFNDKQDLKEILNACGPNMSSDIWGSPYMMRYGAGERPSLRIWSCGPNRKDEQGRSDDINSWEPWQRQLRRYLCARTNAQVTNDVWQR